MQDISPLLSIHSIPHPPPLLITMNDLPLFEDDEDIIVWFHRKNIDNSTLQKFLTRVVQRRMRNVGCTPTTLLSELRTMLSELAQPSYPNHRFADVPRFIDTVFTIGIALEITGKKYPMDFFDSLKISLKTLYPWSFNSGKAKLDGDSTYDSLVADFLL